MADKFNLGDITLRELEGSEANDMSYYRAENSDVRASHYPNCCTGAVLSCLGGSDDAYYKTEDVHGLKEQLVAWIDAIKGGKLRQSKEFISACTTSEQEYANAILKELGFECSKLMTNNVNDYPLYTWVLALSGYEEEE